MFFFFKEPCWFFSLSPVHLPPSFLLRRFDQMHNQIHLVVVDREVLNLWVTRWVTRLWQSDYGSACTWKRQAFKLPNQQRTLSKLSTEIRCRNFITKHRQFVAKRAKEWMYCVHVPTELPFCIPPLVVGYPLQRLKWVLGEGRGLKNGSRSRKVGHLWS